MVRSSPTQVTHPPTHPTHPFVHVPHALPVPHQDHFLGSNQPSAIAPSSSSSFHGRGPFRVEAAGGWVGGKVRRRPPSSPCPFLFGWWSGQEGGEGRCCCGRRWCWYSWPCASQTACTFLRGGRGERGDR